MTSVADMSRQTCKPASRWLHLLWWMLAFAGTLVGYNQGYRVAAAEQAITVEHNHRYVEVQCAASVTCEPETREAWIERCLDKQGRNSAWFALDVEACGKAWEAFRGKP